MLSALSVLLTLIHAEKIIFVQSAIFMQTTQIKFPRALIYSHSSSEPTRSWLGRTGKRIAPASRDTHKNMSGKIIPFEGWEQFVKVHIYLRCALWQLIVGKIIFTMTQTTDSVSLRYFASTVFCISYFDIKFLHFSSYLYFKQYKILMTKNCVEFSRLTIFRK